jgi:hypothetical protein
MKHSVILAGLGCLLTGCEMPPVVIKITIPAIYITAPVHIDGPDKVNISAPVHVAAPKNITINAPIHATIPDVVTPVIGDIHRDAKGVWERLWEWVP